MKGVSMLTLRSFLLFLIFVSPCGAYSEPYLWSGAYLTKGNSIYSNNGMYYAMVRGDGNFVMNRQDGTPLFATNQSGEFVAMQTDGNLVQYRSGQALWHTATAGNPGAQLAVQDDGNMVVYSSNWLPLWHIGPDPGINPAPSNVGDVVARDFDYPGLGGLGHTGVWTGSKVAEVVSGPSNAARFVTWDNFKASSRTWETSKPSIPNHEIFYCFSTWCPYYSAYLYSNSVSARMAIASRTNQIYLIGADYTLAGGFKYALPASPTTTAQRGTYRCDTFVVDAFHHSAGNNVGHTVPAAWWTRINNLVNGSKTPEIVWSALKN